MALSNSQKLAKARYREKAYDTITFDVKKGQRAYYNQEASKRGLSLAELIRRSVNEFIENHQPDSE